MKISALRCKNCGDVIYSRARHDFHYCSCGEIFVDGGFDYLRAGFRTIKPETVEIEVYATKQEFYDDYIHATDKYGLIKGEKNC